MKIKIITVGKVKEEYLVQGIEFYKKLIQKNTPIEMVRVDDEQTPDGAGEKICEKIKTIEGERILKKIRDDDYVVTLEIKGKALNSIQFKKLIRMPNIETLTFVIGGSLGLSQTVMKRSQKAISFSEMTFPHQLMQLILVEQIYRGI